MSTIRFRFTFNQRGTQGPQMAAARKAVNGAIEDVTFRYAARTFDRVKSEIAARVTKDIHSEISHMAGLMKHHITGIGAANRAPTGRMNMAHEMAYVSQALGIEKDMQAGRGIRWENRTARYMSWKRRNHYGQVWFKNKGTLGSYLSRRGTWTTAFGPVRITVSRSKGGVMPSSSLGTLSNRSRNVSKGGRVSFSSPEDTHMRQYVANIRVSALGNITPRMLPALANGSMGDYPDSRKTGLLDMLPTEARLRLAGPKRLERHRHTIEPFLSFMLTRAVPNALFLRVERGLNAKLGITKRF